MLWLRRLERSVDARTKKHFVIMLKHRIDSDCIFSITNFRVSVNVALSQRLYCQRCEKLPKGAVDIMDSCILFNFTHAWMISLALADSRHSYCIGLGPHF